MPVAEVSRWRDIARPIIERVLKDTEGQDEKKIRKALREAFPFGERRYYPYKVWLDEIRVQRGLKKKKPRRQYVDPRQLRLDYGDDQRGKGKG